MKTLRIYLSALFLLTIIGTGCSTYYSDYKEDFPNKVWEKDQVLTFKPKVRDTSAKYDLFLDLRHLYGFHFSDVRIEFKREAPDGSVNTELKRFKVRKDKTTYLGDCSGDICDLRAPVRKGIEFPAQGTYVYRLTPRMGKYEKIPNVMGVGLVLKKRDG